MWLSKLSVERPVFITMVVVVMMVLGFLGLVRLPVDVFPEVSLPVVTVVIPYPGAGPVQVEHDVVEPTENAIAGISGLSETWSIARENLAIIVVVFEMGADIKDVSAELRDRVTGLKMLFPEGVKDPVFKRIDPAATPVLTFAVSSNLSEIDTKILTDKLIKPSIERVEGVGAVNVYGGAKREVQIDLDLPKLAELRIPMMRVFQLIGYDSVDIPAGNLEIPGVRIGLRSRGKVESAEELGAIVIQGVPQPIYLKDVATITTGLAEKESISRVDGKRAVTFDVIKESGSNTVKVCDDVLELVEKLDLPSELDVVPVMDNSTIARDMLHEMQRSLIIGAIMAILVVYLFLVDWRSTVISALALPTSVVTTFFFMWIFGFSLNILSLIAMALAIGVLIDDAVVVREVIFRHQEAGESPRVAAIEGTKEVALAVLATTLSILAVFIPVGFMKGMVGQFFAQFGLTIAIAVSVSLFIAFTMDPMLSSRISRLKEGEPGKFEKKQIEVMNWIDSKYEEILSWSLDHGKSVIAIASLLFITSVSMVFVSGTEFIPAYDRAQFMIDIETAPYSSLEASEEVAEIIEKRLDKIAEVKSVYTIVGVDGAPEKLLMRVATSEKNQRNRSIYEIQSEVRESLSDIPGVNVGVTDPPLLEGADMGDAIEVLITGDNLKELQDVASQVRAGMMKIPGAVNISSSYKPGKPEYELVVDRDKAGTLGLSVGQAGIAMRMAVAGQVVGSMEIDSDTVDIRARARNEDRTPSRLLPNLLLLSPIPRLEDPYNLGTPVALSDISVVNQSTSVPAIERKDRRRFLKVACALAPGYPLSDVQRSTQILLDSIEKPSTVHTEIKGMAEVAGDALVELLVALGLAIIFVYAVLASQFESFVHPFTIMLSLPLAVVGAFATVFLVGWSIGIMTMLGVILLMGLVTKNAILLVDHANQGRRLGENIREAILNAGKVRLRPILMTSLAMILGMLPPAISQGSGSEINQPIAAPVIGGLFASTLLTLVVVPVVYQWVEGIISQRKGK